MHILFFECQGSENQEMYTIEGVISRFPQATGIFDEVPDCSLLILRPEEINEAKHLDGLMATIKTPTGNELSKSIIGSEVNHGVVGVYLANTNKEEIPILSKISW